MTDLEKFKHLFDEVGIVYQQQIQTIPSQFATEAAPAGDYPNLSIEDRGTSAWDDHYTVFYFTPDGKYSNMSAF